MLEAGVDLIELQQILGHVSVLTTSRYTHLTSKTRNNACQAINTLANLLIYMGRGKMILLSSIINEFKDRFFARYKNMVLPGHKKALQAMEQCRKEHGPHMLANAPITTAENRSIFPIPAATGTVPIARTMKTGNGSRISWASGCRPQYYLITFTLPSQLRDLAWKNQKTSIP